MLTLKYASKPESTNFYIAGWRQKLFHSVILIKLYAWILYNLISYADIPIHTVIIGL